MMSSDPMAFDPVAPLKLRELATAFQKSRAFLTAFELDLFTEIDGHDLSAAEAAKRMGTERNATERLLNVLCGLSLLVKNESKFTNSPAASHYLVKGKKGYLAGIMHTVQLWDNWDELTHVVKHGRNQKIVHIEQRGEKWLNVFLAAMHSRALMTAPEIAELLDFSKVNRLLDVGGGSGAYSMAFINKKEGLDAVVFDLPKVVPISQNFIEMEGFSGKVKTIAGNYNTEDIGSGYDMIFLSAIIHINSFGENVRLLHKCYQAMNAGGQIVIQDFIMDASRTTPATGALFALNMLVGTENGDTYSATEVYSWLVDAGFKAVDRQCTSSGTTLIIARK